MSYENPKVKYVSPKKYLKALLQGRDNYFEKISKKILSTGELLNETEEKEKDSEIYRYYLVGCLAKTSKEESKNHNSYYSWEQYCTDISDLLKGGICKSIRCDKGTKRNQKLFSRDFRGVI